MHSQGRKHNLPDTETFVKMLVEGPPPIRHVVQVNVKKSIKNDLEKNATSPTKIVLHIILIFILEQIYL